MQRALDSYDRAKSAVALMRSPADAVNVTTALEDGRYALACVDARLAQQPLPERRPPCFVDPRHGPSVADVAVGAPGPGRARRADVRGLPHDGRDGRPAAGPDGHHGAGQRPYWQAGSGVRRRTPSGYYSPFGNVMTAVMVGTMLSSMWHVPGGGHRSRAVDFAGLGRRGLRRRLAATSAAAAATSAAATSAAATSEPPPRPSGEFAVRSGPMRRPRAGHSWAGGGDGLCRLRLSPRRGRGRGARAAARRSPPVPPRPPPRRR